MILLFYQKERNMSFKSRQYFIEHTVDGAKLFPTDNIIQSCKNKAQGASRFKSMRWADGAKFDNT